MTVKAQATRLHTFRITSCMEARSHLEESTDRFVRYMDEMREFFCVENLPFGNSGCLPAFCRRLEQSSEFRDELAALTRSILFREGGRMPVPDLLSILLVSVAGFGVEAEAESHRAEVAALLRFATGVLRAPVSQPLSASGPASVPVAAPSSRPAPALASEPSPSPESFPENSPWPGKAGDWRLWWGAPALAVAALAAFALLLAPQIRVAAGPPATPAPQPATSPTPSQATEAAAERLQAAAADLQAAAAHLQSAPPTTPPGLTSARLNPPAPPPHRTSLSEAFLTLPARKATPPPAPLPARKPAPTEPSRSQVREISSDLMRTNLISAVPPVYPLLATEARREGTVTLRALISKDGQVQSTHVLSGDDLLRGAAADAVRRWRFRPFLSGGQPVEVSTVLTVHFRLAPGAPACSGSGC